MEEAMGSSVVNRQKLAQNAKQPELTRRELLALSALGLIAGAPDLAQAAGPQGELTWGIHVSLAPTWFDPAETPGLITPFMILYALHDAMMKPMPGQPARTVPCRVVVGGRGRALL
jgi:peptide/nickel transport system substrate-binding protein